MIRVPIVLSELGSDRCRFGHWFVQAGDAVREGDRLAEVYFPGALVEIAAPADGRFVERIMLRGDALTAGQVLGTIEPPADP